MPPNTLHRVSPAAWLRHLGSPDTRVQVSVGGVAARFRTPPEWDTRPRRIDEHLVYFFAKESARAEVEGDTFICPRGSCYWVTPGTTFRFFSNRSPVLWRFRFSLTTAPNGRPVAPRQTCYFLANNPAAAETINALLSELTRQDRWQPAALRSWLIQFSILFFRSLNPAKKSRVLTAQQLAAISVLVENGRPDSSLKPRDLAKAAGLSLDYFSRVFHLTHGVSPRHWLVRQRLSYAVVLLQETPLRVGEIAHRLGYTNPYLFTRQFTLQFGRSPRSFRL